MRTGMTKRVGTLQTMESVDVLAKWSWILVKIAAAFGAAGTGAPVTESMENRRIPDASQKVAIALIFVEGVTLLRAEAAVGSASFS